MSDRLVDAAVRDMWRKQAALTTHGERFYVEFAKLGRFGPKSFGTTYAEYMRAEARAAIEAMRLSTVITVNADLCHLVDEAAHQLPMTTTLHLDDPWTAVGYVWFETPIQSLTIDHRTGEQLNEEVQGIYWYLGYGTDIDNREASIPLLSYCVYSTVDCLAQRLPREDARLVVHLPTDIGKWPANETAGVIGEGDRLDTSQARDRLIVWSLWYFLKQALVNTTPGRMSRAVQRQARRQGEVPNVTIATLRRVRHERQAPHMLDVDWSHRWIVRGHWRQQWYPTLEQHRPVWIAPHVKGPDDKPLVVKQKIARLVR